MDRCPHCGPHAWHGLPCTQRWSAPAWGGDQSKPCDCQSSFEAA